MPLSDRDYMKKSPPSSPRRSWRPSYSALNPVLVLIAINFVFYVASLINNNIIFRLGLTPSLFSERPWTLLTAMFIHEGFWHLFGNMITLFFFGTFLARLIGSNWFLLIYLVGGIVGNVLYLLLNLSSPFPVIGASGAVYTIAGALVVMMPRLPVRLYFVIPVPLWAVVLIFFVAWSFIPGVAWQAHMGGLAVGLVAGLFFRQRIRPDFYR